MRTRGREWVLVVVSVLWQLFGLCLLAEGLYSYNPRQQWASRAVQTSWGPAIPAYLVPCYHDDRIRRRHVRVPLTMANLVDLVRRVERQPDFVVNLRMMTTTLLHRFRVDGLERDPNVHTAPGVTPYRPTGVQFARSNLLMRKLLSGNAELFPNSSLTTTEQCALHLMLSATVDPWERGDESTVCPKEPTPRGGSPNNPPYPDAPHDPMGGIYWSQRRGYPDPRLDVGLWGGGSNISPPPPAPPPTSSWSACPVEEGVVEDGSGAVAAGAVLAGIAAGLQPQTVPLASLISPSHLARLRADGGQETNTISNLWAATLAGDLAEVAIYQGPLDETGGLYLGPDGRWDDDAVPRVRYFARTRPGSPEQGDVRRWDMTDAEIRGGFDGLALGAQVRGWARRLNRLRLSQLLEMYYSPRGVAFQPDVRACRRSKAVAGVLSAENLLIQTASVGRTLASWSPDAPYMTEAALRNFSSSALRAFHKYGSALLSSESCEQPPKTDIRANLLAILDATWDPDTAFRFLSMLVTGADVSLFGSRIGVMSGEEQGRWIVNFTDSPVRFATDWEDGRGGVNPLPWPTRMDLPWSLVAAMHHLVSQAEGESAAGVVGSVRGDLVIIMAATSPVNDADMRHAQKLIPQVKEINPDAHFLYVVSDTSRERFQQLADLDPLKEDAVVVLPRDSGPERVAEAVLNYLRQTVTGRLTPPECVLTGTQPPSWPVQAGVRMAPGVTGASSRLVRGQLEDYVSPGQLRLYRVHPAYLRPGHPLNITVVSEGYGDVLVCMWRGATRDEPREALRHPREPQEPHSADMRQVSCGSARELSETTLTLQQPCADGCAPVFVSVAANRTLFKCAEDDCRYPDQVRYVLRLRGLFCGSGDQGAGGSDVESNGSAAAHMGRALCALLVFSSVAAKWLR